MHQTFRHLMRGLGALLLLLAVGVHGVAQEGDEEKRPAVPQGMYDKPYIKKFGGAAVGGYIDMEWEITDEKNTFDQHRFIPFIFSEVTPRVHFATEIEFEHGGRVPEGGGEIKLEFAALDIRFTDWLVYRGGVILAPLGKFNLVHDSPWNDFTTRPLVDQELIPTTLSESGMGFHGEIYPSQASVLGYEIYLVNGFNEGILAGGPGGFVVRMENGTGSLESDNNIGKSVVSRVVYSPFLGFEVGASVHTGTYDDDDEHRLTIGALDASLTRGPFELLAEGAVSSTGLPGDESLGQLGFYLQPNFHFGFGLIPGFPNSKFTAMIRLGYVDFNQDLDGEQTTRYTAGINWRPVEEAAVKMEYVLETDTPRGTTDPNDGQGTFFFGFASYF